MRIAKDTQKQKERWRAEARRYTRSKEEAKFYSATDGGIRTARGT